MVPADHDLEEELHVQHQESEDQGESDHSEQEEDPDHDREDNPQEAGSDSSVAHVSHFDANLYKSGAATAPLYESASILEAVLVYGTPRNQ